MVARGHVQNGVIVLDDGVRLPEGQKVTVVTAAMALQFRAAWMRKMGFTQEEIDAACLDDGSPIDLAEELEQLHYANLLKDATPSWAVLDSWAIN
jgi:hypothetical protein